MSTTSENRSIDIIGPAFWGGDFRAELARLRAEDPVHWDAENELWGITRYDHVVELEKRKDIFISSDRDKGGYRPNIPSDPSIIGLDDPEHTKRRMLVARRFTPRSVSQWEPHIRAAVVRLIDDAVERGRAEVIGDLAAPLPAMMIGSLLGFPDEAWPKLQDWSERTIALGGGPQYFDEDGTAAAMEFAGEVAELFETKKANPGTDIMSAWVDVADKGLPDYEFGVAEVVSDCLLLLDGGAETTRTVIARLLVELAQNDAQWQALKDGADLDVATEEFIRWVTPVHNMCRVATEDYELDGKTIRAGQQVVLLYASANFDEDHFSNAEDLDVTRHPNQHIAFGFGTHFCLGSSLARLEIRTFFEELLRRVDSLDRLHDEPHVEMPNAFVYGLRESHVALHEAS